MPENTITANAPSRYPLADWQKGFNEGAQYSAGNDGRLAVCLHIADGGYQTSIDYLRSIGLSAHFLVSEQGTVAQMVGIHDTAWTQGLSYEGGQWYSPKPRHQLVHPTWQLIRPGMDVNRHLISIEHAGWHTAPRPTVQMNATIALLKWLASWFPSLNPYTPGKSLIGHNMLDTVGRTFCPGPYFDLARIAAGANPPKVRRFRVLPTAVYQRQDCTGPIAGYLSIDQYVEVDAVYPNGVVHLASGLGFVRGERLEEI